MAETLISPGVLARENDQTFVGTRPVPVGTAIIGPTIKGPVEVPTLVTTWSEYNTKFGTTAMSGSATNKKLYSYFTSIAAYNYFANGGNALLVTRIASGSFSPATSSTVVTGSGTPQAISPFVLETFTYGNIMNSTSPQTSGGVLTSGSQDNIRWQIVNSNTSSGTFDLLIRRGDDSTRNPIVLETWTGLSLDPLTPNYISRVIGDIRQNYDISTQQITYTGSFTNKSNYVIVNAVNFTTPNYIDANGNITSAFTGSMPINFTGSFGGGTGDVFGKDTNFYNSNTASSTNSQGLLASQYTNSINLLTTNKEDYKYNVLLTPGLFYDVSTHTTVIDSVINNTQNRGDSIYVPDLVSFGSSISTVTNKASSLNTSYAAAYWPWLQVVEPSSGEVVWVPASTMIGGVYAFNDSVAEPWFAPAGINRGGLTGVVRAELRLSQQNRDTLYAGRVNPIATFPGTGVVVYGQKTLQAKASALDRVNVRRLLIALKAYISNVALGLVFEQNTAATRNSFLAQVNPYLASVQQRQGLYAFKVVMDDSNNSADVIDRNEMYGQIYLQPTKTAEFIYLDFNITPTGASFPA
jgi:hypothetical protein